MQQSPVSVEQIITMISEVKQDPSCLTRLDRDSDIIHDAGLDSIQLIHFILRVEDDFNVEIDFEEFDMEHLGSIQAFCNFVSHETGQDNLTEEKVNTL
ncbi:acyl carrier protein [Paenibacillus sp. PsM32]|uniref:Acyl carrier protein n=2 Tax=Paenibacillus TaxID=44249 RepID=A0ABW4UXU7_9BACL|nr:MULTISPECIES: acyl carrier protein [Paenibacillus]MDN4616893.1 acyl carrier protein [Paenibacillus sp. PsM32]MDQ1233265.1 acyl carrier protein [Paenibacillus sp. SORGH_AS_0306]MDR6110308.1 acyl carrier protein [Paenibacillus sp. SORGH_AS_0338]WCT57263.1 acyl carrier protein [Paenibacillus kyungheensis]WDF49636.1 acyl carrier protein [Paenibacillus sp. KACC 21273]